MEFLDTGWVKVRPADVPSMFKEAWTRRGWLIGLDFEETFTVINRAGEVLTKLRSINLKSAKHYANDKIGAPIPRGPDLEWWKFRQACE